MKLLQPYQYSNIVAVVLLLLCQLLSSTVSQGFNDTAYIGDDYFETQTQEVLNGYSSGLSSINDPSNRTGFSAEDPASTPNDDQTGLSNSGTTMPTEQSEESTGLPVSGSMITVDVVSTINLKLSDTLGLMNEGQLEAFHEITVGFLVFYIFKGNQMPSLVEEEGLELELLGQKSLTEESVQQRTDWEEPLFVSFRVTGKINTENTINLNSIVADENLLFDQELKDLFTEREEEYLESLKFVDGDFFSSVKKTNIVLEGEINEERSGQNTLEEEEDEKPSDFGSFDTPDFVDIPESPYPNIVPTSTESSGSVQESSGNEEIQGSFLSLGAIIAIAISGAVILVTFVFLIYFIRRRGNRGMTKLSPRKTKLSPRKNKGHELTDSDDSVADLILLGSHKVLSDRKSGGASNDDLESQGMDSYNKSQGSAGSVYTSGQSSAGTVYTHGSNIRIFSDYSFNYGSEVSYAYSLEQGIEASVVDGAIPNVQSSVPNQNGRSVPIREIPQVRMNTAKPGGFDHSKNKKTKNKKEEFIMQDHFGNTQIETAPSDLKLTKSELEMLPSNLRSSTDESDYDAKSSSDFGDFESSNKFVTRKILAPAGKLGILVDTSADGSVVQSVKRGSKLTGKIFSGDIIVAIDDVDTRAMSSSAITTLMIKTVNQTRNVTVRRKL